METSCSERSRFRMRLGSYLRPFRQLTRADWWAEQRLKIIGFLWLVALIAGLVGFYELSVQYKQNRSWSDLVYQTLHLPFMPSDLLGKQINGWLDFARFFTPLLTLITGFQAVVLLLGDRLQDLKLRHLCRGHVVICGLGRKGTVLAEQFRERGERLVLIDKSGDSPSAQHFREEGVIVLTGDATDLALLRKAQVGRASRIVCLCPDDESNAQICMRSWELAEKKRRKPTSCLVQVSSPDLCELLRTEMIAKETTDQFRVEFFNIFQAGAWALLNQYPPFDEKASLLGHAPHVVIVGLGRFGNNVLRGLAKKWRQFSWDSKDRLRITVVDKDAQSKIRVLFLVHPKLQSVCEVVPWSGEIQSAEFQEGGFLANDQGTLDVSRVYICLGDQLMGVRAALSIRHALRGARIPVIVRMNDARGLSALLAKNKEKDARFGPIHPFNLIENTCDDRLVHGVSTEILAQAIHANYLENEARLAGQDGTKKMTLLPWEGLPEIYRESNRRQADHIATKLDAVGCSLTLLRDWDAELFRFTTEEVEKLAIMEHERWCDERVADGWTVGPRNELWRKHPSLVPWEQLSKDDQDRDRDTVLRLPEILASIDLQIYRVATVNRS